MTSTISTNQFKIDFWYAKGNIMRSFYSNNRGFWLVTSDVGMITELKKCDSHGNILYPTIRRHTIYNEGWMWENMNEGVHPLLDRYNAFWREHYLKFTDEYIMKLEIEREGEWKKFRQMWKNMTLLEREIYNFDWTYQEADSPNVQLSIMENFLFNELRKLPADEAIRIFKKYGPAKYNYRGNLTREKDRYLLAAF